MGYYKNLKGEIDARGYDSIGDKYVCFNCFEDDALKDFVMRNASAERCDYCRTPSQNSIAAPVDKVLELIAESLLAEWDDPVNEVLWDGREGGWQGVGVLDTSDLFHTVSITDQPSLQNDIIQAFGGRQWCQKNPYELPGDEKYMLSWRMFIDAIAHKRRYFFACIPSQFDLNLGIEWNPEVTLRQVAHVVKEAGLVTTLTEGVRIYRSRVHSEGVSFETVTDLGPPPVDQASAGRMNAAGIPMFYGATTTATALAEATLHRTGHCATVGTWETTKPLKIIDLTKIPEIPSLFDSERRYLRSGLRFLHSFADDISHPIDLDGREHIEYSPTQVLAEYFRWESSILGPLHGVQYRSQRDEAGSNLVLFFDGDQLNPNTEAPAPLQLVSHAEWQLEWATR